MSANPGNRAVDPAQDPVLNVDTNSVDTNHPEENCPEETCAEENCAEENPAADARPGGAPRKLRKSVLLPDVVQMSLENISVTAISKRLGLSRRTIDRWLEEQRRIWAEKAAKCGVDLYAVTIARLESAYGTAMEAFRDSQADKEVFVESTTSGDKPTVKKMHRTETRTGQAAFLGQAVRAAQEIVKLTEKHAQALADAEARRGRESEEDRLELDGRGQETLAQRDAETQAQHGQETGAQHRLGQETQAQHGRETDARRGQETGAQQVHGDQVAEAMGTLSKEELDQIRTLLGQADGPAARQAADKSQEFSNLPEHELQALREMLGLRLRGAAALPAEPASAIGPALGADGVAP
jgi:hypothetical protein